MTNLETTFNVKKMKKLSQKDKLIGFVLKDLKRKGHKEDYVLKIIFNSYILCDSIMKEVYSQLSIE